MRAKQFVMEGVSHAHRFKDVHSRNASGVLALHRHAVARDVVFSWLDFFSTASISLGERL
jgi:hypothetical protein